MRNRTKFTMAGTRDFAAANEREAVLWNRAAPGLGLRVRTHGRKKWIVHQQCNGSVAKRTLGDRRVDEETAKEVRNWFDDLEATRAGTANRTLAALSLMTKRTKALGLRREDSNPCTRDCGGTRPKFEVRYLWEDEFAALSRAVLLGSGEGARRQRSSPGAPAAVLLTDNLALSAT